MWPDAELEVHKKVLLENENVILDMFLFSLTKWLVLKNCFLFDFFAILTVKLLHDLNLVHTRNE